MNKTLFRNLLRKIKKNFSGFITISVIVALGVGFLVGLLMTTTDLRETVDEYYDLNKVYDINLKSNIGFEKEEVSRVLEENLGDDVLDYTINYQLDEHVTHKNEKITARKIYYPFESATMDLVEIKEGRYPQTEYEIAVERKSQFIEHIGIDEKIIINEKEYTVVGIVANPKYFSNEKEFTTVSPGRLDTIIYLNEKFYNEAAYTDINIALKTTVELNTFSKEYYNAVENYKNHIDTFKNDLFKDHYQSIIDQIRTEVQKGVYNELVNRFGESIADMMIDTEQVISQIDALVKDQVSLLGEPTVYVLDRRDSPSYYMFEIQSQKTNDISSIFPVFFLIIATLITLSTLERMIQEDRVSIGTLKSLGYPKRAISSIYILYSGFAAIFGILLGSFIGIWGLPWLIYFIFNVLFMLPPMVYTLNPLVYILTTLGLLIAIILATTITLTITLKEKPNSLLTTKPIKGGTKILLEKVKFIWNRLKFKYKSTIRNIFRYKKNAIMMVVGVAGSTALVLGAFGMADSIGAVTGRQFNDILLYNTIVNVKDYEQDPFENKNNIKSSDVVYTINAVAADNHDFDIKIIGEYGDTDLNNYVNFIENNKKINLENDSIFISSQLSEMLKIYKDDVFFFEVNDKLYNVMVTGVVENHVSNYIYCSEKTFKSIFKNTYEPNSYIAIVNDIETVENQERFLRELGENKNITSIDLTYQNKASYDSLLTTLSLVVFVLIIFAGALEITSIYSLTNISVSERTRELATLKVLGYRKREVVGYIYRETTILAIVGTLLGYLLGFMFHQYVVGRMQFAGLSIGYTINPLSYLYATLIGLFFFAIVDLVFFPKINHLSMTESLKSVE